MLLAPSVSFADPALRYQRVSYRVARRDARISNRIERRNARISNRIYRRNMLWAPPRGAVAVSVGGRRCYRVGAVVYRPVIYQGETVYVVM